MYITAQEYNILSGELISPLDLFKYDSAFKGFIHPNNYMVENFYTENGVYPTEIKLAMVDFINFMKDNQSTLDGIPVNANTVGSTSVNYISKISEMIYAGRIKLPTTTLKILKTTNVLSPIAYKGCSVFRGTPFNIEDFQEVNEDTGEVEVTPSVTGSTKQLLDMQKLLQDMPSVDVTIWKQVQTIEDGVLTTDYKYEVTHVVKGWFRENKSDSNERSAVIIDAYDINDEPVKLLRSNRVSYILNGENRVFTCERFDTHLDYEGKPHHYFIDAE